MPKIDECLETNILWLILHDEIDEARSLIEEMSEREVAAFMHRLSALDDLLTECQGGKWVDNG
jgi:hypothetical protein